MYPKYPKYKRDKVLVLDYSIENSHNKYIKLVFWYALSVSNILEIILVTNLSSILHLYTRVQTKNIISDHI